MYVLDCPDTTVTRMIALMVYFIITTKLENHLTQAVEEVKVRTHLFTGTMFHPTSKIVYVSAVPIVYKIPRDANTYAPIHYVNRRPCIKNNRTTACKIEENINHLQREILKQLNIEALNFEEERNITRKTRGLTFISSFLKWCCDVATVDQVANVMENEEQFVTDANRIIDRVNSDHKTLLNSTENFNNFTKNVGEVTGKIYSNINLLQLEINELKQDPELLNQLYISVQTAWKFQYINYYYDNLREVKTMCHERKLPKTLISRDKLTEDIKELSISLKDKNLKPAITYQNLDLYYTLPITTCYIRKEEILIRIKIPLTRADSEFKIYRNIPVPLNWQDRLCYVTKQKYTIVTSTEELYVLDPEEENCDKISNPLCLLPRHQTSPNPEHNCIRHIIKQSPVKELKKYCQFTCFNKEDHLQVTKLLPNKYLVTNIQTNLTLLCPDHNITRVLPKDRAGTVEIKIPCLCKVLDEANETIISPIYPCDKYDVVQPEITHLIPMTWTKFQTISITPLEQPIRHSFEMADEIIKQNWTLQIPTIFVDEGERQDTLQHIKLKNTKGDLLNNTSLILYILMGYCVFLTLIIIILIYCVVINNAKLKMIVPRVIQTSPEERMNRGHISRRNLKRRKENIVN